MKKNANENVPSQGGTKKMVASATAIKKTFDNKNVYFGLKNTQPS